MPFIISTSLIGKHLGECSSVLHGVFTSWCGVLPAEVLYLDNPFAWSPLYWTSGGPGGWGVKHGHSLASSLCSGVVHWSWFFSIRYGSRLRKQYGIDVWSFGWCLSMVTILYCTIIKRYLQSTIGMQTWQSDHSLNQALMHFVFTNLAIDVKWLYSTDLNCFQWLQMEPS